MHTQTQPTNRNQRSFLILYYVIIPLTLIILVVVSMGSDRFGEIFMNMSISPHQSNQVDSVFHEIPRVSLAEAQQQLPFQIPLPRWLPDGVSLQGAHVQPPNWVNVFYTRSQSIPGPTMNGLGIQITHGDDGTTSHLVDAQVETVSINGHSARYEWIAGGDSGRITWTANGFTYEVGGSGLGLSREDLIRIAESIH